MSIKYLGSIDCSKSHIAPIKPCILLIPLTVISTGVTCNPEEARELLSYMELVEFLGLRIFNLSLLVRGSGFDAHKFRHMHMSVCGELSKVWSILDTLSTCEAPCYAGDLNWEILTKSHMEIAN